MKIVDTQKIVERVLWRKKIVDSCLQIIKRFKNRVYKNRRHVSTNSEPAAGAKNLSTFDRKNCRHVSTNSEPAAGANNFGHF